MVKLSKEALFLKDLSSSSGTVWMCCSHLDNSDFAHDITSFTHATFVTGLQKTKECFNSGKICHIHTENSMRLNFSQKSKWRELYN